LFYWSSFWGSLYILYFLGTSVYIWDKRTQESKKIITHKYSISGALFDNNERMSHKKDLVRFGTIHSFLNLRPSYDKETGKKIFTKEKNNNKFSFGNFNCDILIIDESSMISTDLKQYILSEAGTRFNRILFVGDEYQLLAVDNKIKDNISIIFDNSEIFKCKLLHVIRQKDMEVINFLKGIRILIEKKSHKNNLFRYLRLYQKKTNNNKLKFYDSHTDFLKSYVKDCEQNLYHNNVIGTFTNHKVNIYNKLMHKYFKKTEHDLVKNDILVIQDTIFDNDGNVKLHNSERVTCKEFLIKKEPIAPGLSKKVDILYITVQNEMGGFISFKSIPHKTRKYYEDYLEMLIKYKHWEEFYKIKEDFVEYKFHYSSTIHKLQGSTVDNIWIDMRINGIRTMDDDMLLRLFYVGSSRTKNNIHILI